jgi:thioredoxin 2
MAETKTNFVCPNCSAVNRVDKSRFDEGPVCGECKQLLFPDHPVELTDETFQKFVTRNEVPVIVDFWAPWCPPCRKMGPEFAKAAAQLAPDFILAKVDTEASPNAAAPFNITGIPCMIAFRNGQEFARQAGGMSVEQIVQWIKSI